MDELTREVMKVKLLKVYPGLVAFPSDNWAAQLTTAAKNARFELKAAFPGVKFRVTTERFSMGNALRVGWTDGPTTEQVEAIVKKYQDGSFNGMEDIYEYNNDVFNDIFGVAKYVSCSRSYSDALVTKAIAAFAEKFGVEPATLEDYRKGNMYRMPVYESGGFNSMLFNTVGE